MNGKAICLWGLISGWNAMSLRYSCCLDVNEDNVCEYDVSSSMQTLRIVKSMDMVLRMQTVGRLEALFESYDDEFLKLFKHGRGIDVQARPASQAAASRSDRRIYAGYVSQVERQPQGKILVTAEYALWWLHHDDDTATYVDVSSRSVVIDALSRGSAWAPWHQTRVNPRGLAPGTYQFGVLGASRLGPMTLLGAYFPRRRMERGYQRLGRVDAVTLDFDSPEKSGSLFSILMKAVLSEAGYLYVYGGVVFLGRYGWAFMRTAGRSHSLTAWDGVGFGDWRQRVSELAVLSPTSAARHDALFDTLRNFAVAAGSSFYEFESYVNGYPVEITGGIRLEGLPDGVECFPSYNGFHLYLQFENAGRERVVIEELAIYADVVQIESVSRQVARTGHRGGRQAMLEFANLAGEEEDLLEHYIQGFQAQNELSAIYLMGKNLAPALAYDLMQIVDLKKDDIDEAAYIQSMEWAYAAGVSRLVIGLWPFTEYNYGLVGVEGHQEVGQVVVGI